MKNLYQSIILQQEKVSSLEVEQQNIEQELFSITDGCTTNMLQDQSKNPSVYVENQIRSHYKSITIVFIFSLICIIMKPMFPWISKNVIYFITIIFLGISNGAVAFHYHKKRMLEKNTKIDNPNEEYIELKKIFEQTTNELSFAKSQLENLKKQFILDYMRKNPEKLKELIEREILLEQMKQYDTEFSSNYEKISHVKKYK